MFDQALISLPPNLILYCFFDEADTLKYVCDIIDSSFLDFENPGGFVQVDFLRWRALNEFNESFGKLTQAVVYSIFLNSKNLVAGDVSMNDAPRDWPRGSRRTSLSLRVWLTDILEDSVGQAADREHRWPTWTLLGVQWHPDILQRARGGSLAPTFLLLESGIRQI